MNVTCNKCGKRYVIADEKIAGKASVKIRCKQCQNLIQLTGGSASSGSSASIPGAAPAMVSSASPSAVSVSREAAAAQRSPWEDEATRAMPAPDLTTQWFAMIQGKQEGPLDLRGMGMKVNGGEITLRTYLWKPGMEGWKRAADVPEVSSVFSGGTGASATATGPMQASPETQRSARASAPKRDVAVANEMPAADFASVSQIIASTPSTAPAPGATARAPAPVVAAEAPLKDLFNDVHDGTVNGNGKAGAATAVPDKDDEESTKGDVDPFAALGGSGENEAPPPGEATKFFMAQAGVNRRNPPWKIALFVVSVFVVPATALYLLSTLHVLPTVTVTTADGEVVQENFFSPSGIGGLKDILTGDKKRKAADAENRRAAAQAAREKAAKAPVLATNTVNKPDVLPTPKPPDKGLADFYGNDTKKVNVPKGGRDDDRPPVVASGGGLSSDAAMKIVADKRKSFEQCIDAALRRTPNLAVGNIVVVLTVGSSGAVKSVGVTPKKWEGADWAVCMMTAGKRIVFPGSDGDTDIEVPLKVGVAL